MTARSVPRRALAFADARPHLVACRQCDALYQRPRLASGQQSRCRRCGAMLGRGHRLSLQGLLALTLSALVVFLIANLNPVVLLNLNGIRNAVSLPSALQLTWAAGEPLVALLAAATAVVFPLAVIVLRLYALTPVWSGRRPPGWSHVMRALVFASRWSMVEVLMLSALVAIVRIASEALVVPGVGLVAFGGLALLLAALEAAGVHRLWDCMEQAAR